MHNSLIELNVFFKFSLTKKHCTKYMNLVQCLYMENPISPGSTSEVRSAEAAILRIVIFQFIIYL